MRILTYTEVRNNLKRTLDSVIDDADITVIHRRDGEDAVLIGRSYHESLQETLYLLSNPVNAAALFKVIAEDKAGIRQEYSLLDADE